MWYESLPRVLENLGHDFQALFILSFSANAVSEGLFTRVIVGLLS